MSAQKRPWRPADLLTVMEARELHAILATGNVRFGVQKQVCNGSSDGGGWCDNQTYKSRAFCSIAWKRGAQMKDIKKIFGVFWRFVAVQEPRHSDNAIPELLPNNRVPLSATRPTGCLLRFVFLSSHTTFDTGKILLVLACKGGKAAGIDGSVFSQLSARRLPAARVVLA